jgi:hypothetical protein
MTIKSIALGFLPPDTQWPAPTIPLDIPCTALCYCADGALLSILVLEANEVLNRIPRDQLFAQVADLKAQSPWAYLVIIGGLEPANDGYTHADGQYRKFHWNATQGALLSIQELGVSILHIDHEQELGPLLERLGKRDRTTKRALAQRGIEPMSVAEDILLSLPGIGEKQAHRVLADCGGNAIWSLIALANLDCMIPGIGDGTRRKVREALGLLPDQNITLIQPDDRIVPASMMEVAA